MNKKDKYKHLPEGAKKHMYLTAILVIVIMSAVLLTAALLIWKGTILGRLPHRGVLAAILVAIAALADIYNLVAPSTRFKRYSYFIDEDEINIRSGVIMHKVEIVPIERVHKIETVAGPIDRRFGLSSVDIYTAGGEIDIHYLPAEEAEEIAELLKKKVNEIIQAQRADNTPNDSEYLINQGEAL